MEWFKKQLQLIEENEKRLLNSRKEIQEKIAKIEELLPEEKVCVYLYGKVHGFDNQGIDRKSVV